MVSTRDSYFSSEFEFTTDNGLMIAFGLTDYQNNREPIEDADYGTLRAYYKYWGMEGDDAQVYWQQLEAKTCTPEQLGLIKNEKLLPW